MQRSLIGAQLSMNMAIVLLFSLRTLQMAEIKSTSGVSAVRSPQQFVGSAGTSPSSSGDRWRPSWTNRTNTFRRLPNGIARCANCRLSPSIVPRMSLVPQFTCHGKPVGRSPAETSQLIGVSERLTHRLTLYRSLRHVIQSVQNAAARPIMRTPLLRPGLQLDLFLH